MVLAWDLAGRGPDRGPARAPDSPAPAKGGAGGASGFFFHYERPKIGGLAQGRSSRDPTCAGMPEEAF